jgi:N-acetylmuramoyl-L-alanine amidase
MASSVDFAKEIQKQFRTTGGRVDRGVHQAGLLVLARTSMPAVLVELGYINNANEEKYLNSSAGVATLAKSIYNAFVAYKK